MICTIHLKPGPNDDSYHRDCVATIVIVIIKRPYGDIVK